jgi:hypothetical protein
MLAPHAGSHWMDGMKQRSQCGIRLAAQRRNLMPLMLLPIEKTGEYRHKYMLAPKHFAAI